MKKHPVCWILFSSMLRISAFTFGGGFVIIPLMHNEFVGKLNWLKEEDMLDMHAIARSSPGAVTVNIASQLGYRMAGVKGAVAGVSGAVLPPLVWLTLISLCYDAFRASAVVDAFLRSMQPAVAAVILCAAFDMLKSIREKRKCSSWLVFAAALALGLYGVNVIWILLGGGIIGAAISGVGGKRHAD